MEPFSSAVSHFLQGRLRWQTGDTHDDATPLPDSTIYIAAYCGDGLF